MKISYIPPVVLSASSTVSVSAASVDQSMLEKAISNAIHHTIVAPLQHWLLNGWIKFVGLSYWLCLAIATAGVICAICGIPKGKKWAICSIIFYIIIRMVSYYNGWQ